VAECFLSPELGFHSHTRPLASRDGCCSELARGATAFSSPVRLDGKRCDVGSCDEDGGTSLVNVLPHDAGAVKDTMVVRIAQWVPARGAVARTDFGCSSCQ